MAFASCKSDSSIYCDYSPRNVVYFKGFSSNTDKDTILSIFGKYGTLKRFHLEKDKYGKCLGRGSVEYETDEIAKYVIKRISGKNMFGRKIITERFIPEIRPKKNYHGSYAYSSRSVNNSHSINDIKYPACQNSYSSRRKSTSEYNQRSKSSSYRKHLNTSGFNLASVSNNPFRINQQHGIYFKGFSSNTDKKTILSIFGKYGTLKRCHLEKDKHGKFLGRGSVEYETDEIVKYVIKRISGINVCGRKIIAEKLIPKVKLEKDLFPFCSPNEISSMNNFGPIKDDIPPPSKYLYSGVTKSTLEYNQTSKTSFQRKNYLGEDYRNQSQSIIIPEIKVEKSHHVSSTNMSRSVNNFHPLNDYMYPDIEVSYSSKRKSTSWHNQSKFHYQRKHFKSDFKNPSVKANQANQFPIDQQHGVYFKGFASNTEKETILSIFGKHGTLKSFHFGKDKNGKFLGHGSIEYENEESVTKAIERIPGMIVYGSKISVEKFIPKEKREEAKEFNNIYVKNFIDDIHNEDELKQLFNSFGDIKSVKVVTDDKGQSKGFGYVCFTNTADARKAVDSMNDYILPSGKLLYAAKHQKKSIRNGNLKPPLQRQNTHPTGFDGSSTPIHSPTFDEPENWERKYSLSQHFPRFTQTADFSTYKQSNQHFDGTPASDDFRNIYIKNFGDTIQENRELCSLFENFGRISSARVMKDENNRSLGFGFVSFYSSQSAKNAVKSMNDFRYNGNVLYVGKAMNKTERQQELRRSFLTKLNVPQKRMQNSKRTVSVTSMIETECNICIFEMNESDCVMLECKHIICKECIGSYVEYAVNSKEVNSILCPKDKCDSEITFDLIRDLIPLDLLQKYDKCLLDNYLNKCKDIIWCPKSDCRCPVYLSTDSPTLGNCPQCDYLFCTKCGEGYHSINPCNEFDNDAQKMEVIDRYMNGTEDDKANLVKRYSKKKLDNVVEEHLSNLCIKQECKECPSCKTNIQKNEGCNKMICAKCKTFFCWLCLKILNKSSPYDHFNTGKCLLFAVPENLI